MLSNVRRIDCFLELPWFRRGLVVLACLILDPRVLEAAGAARPNVLFIAVDDLRPEIFSFGRERMITPNLDRLAARGVRFQRAYCMVPNCGASRASLMTGIRPTRNRFVSPVSYAEKDAPGVTTLNTHFKSHGYHTVSNGKVFHHADDNEEGWSEKPWLPTARAYAKAESFKAAKKSSGKRKFPPFEWADVADNFYRDGLLADKAIADLGRLAGGREPFFLAIGFFKPHLPFVAPTSYWQRYPAKTVHLPDNYFVPNDAPDVAIHNFAELRSYSGVPQKGPLADDMASTLIRGYYACVSYVDAQIGRVLDELDRLGLAESTIIVLWGDHGWNLGEHTLWSKNCCFETSMNAPLIVSAPMLDGIQTGAKTLALTEFIDIYPSLCDLAGLPAPEHLGGTSFVPMLKRPSASYKDVAIGRFNNGDTIRTDRYRYTLYTEGNGDVLGRMLYDHQEDPDENVNIVGRPELASTVKRLEAQLLAGMGKPE